MAYSNEQVLARLQELRDMSSVACASGVKFEVVGTTIKTVYATYNGLSGQAVIVLGHHVENLMDKADRFGTEFVNHIAKRCRVELAAQQTDLAQLPYDKLLDTLGGSHGG